MVWDELRYCVENRATFSAEVCANNDWLKDAMCKPTFQQVPLPWSGEPQETVTIGNISHFSNVVPSWNSISHWPSLELLKWFKFSWNWMLLGQSFRGRMCQNLSFVLCGSSTRVRCNWDAAPAFVSARPRAASRRGSKRSRWRYEFQFGPFLDRLWSLLLVHFRSSRSRPTTAWPVPSPSRTTPSAAAAASSKRSTAPKNRWTNQCSNNKGIRSKNYRNC